MTDNQVIMNILGENGEKWVYYVDSFLTTKCLYI